MNFMTASVDIKVDDSKLKTQLAKARSAVTRTVERIKTSFRKMGAAFKAVFSKMVHYAKWAGLAIAGAFFFVTRAAMKQQDVIKRLNITLKATGYAAGFTAKQLLDQAAALQKVTRFGDETITAMQTMLLTFKNIKGDEFKRATEAALDMATAEAAVSGRAVDLTAVSIRLGKALNDPILGLTALARVGVDFTEVQKNLIKELVMAGRVAEAQAVILKELENQFGGMSRDVDTASGALKQMWNALGDVAEKIGGAFLLGIQDTSKAIKEWAIRNEERIGQWAKAAAAYLTYVKDVLWVFVKFLQSDWKAGLSYALKVSLELFKGFARGVLVVLTDMAESAGRAITIQLRKALGPKASDLLKIADPSQIGMAERRHIAPISERLKFIAGETAERVGGIAAPPEVIKGLDEAMGKLKTSLGEIGVTAEEIQKPMEKALVDTPKRMTKAMEEAQGKMKQWASDAKNMWSNLSDIAVGALDGVSDALANLFIKGKADFAALAQSIMMDLTKMIIKAQMAQMLGAFMPSLFGTIGAGAGAGAIPGLQGGGLVAKTGLAVVHKGEEFSGVDDAGNKARQQKVALTINVNAIDAAGTYQFLSKNKRAIATMLQGMLTANHSLRRSKSWKS